MLLRTSGASRLYIAKLAASATASARANRATFFHSCGHHGVRRTGTARTGREAIEIAPEREVADDGEPEGERQRDRARRARPTQEVGEAPAGASQAAPAEGWGRLGQLSWA